jgi:hypothetical protein
VDHAAFGSDVAGQETYHPVARDRILLGMSIEVLLAVYWHHNATSRVTRPMQGQWNKGTESERNGTGQQGK